MSDYLNKRREWVNAGKPKEEKKVYRIPKISKKKQAEIDTQKENKGDTGLDKWFEARRKEMTGKCALCGGRSEKHSDDHYRKSIHHIFEKRPTMFPSVALHPDNWLEVCFWNNSCHTNLHNGTITWELLMDSAEREIILDKAKRIIPSIHPQEQKKIPEIILNLLK